MLVLPGLFQSFACWRPITSMLAHRGWEVYCLTRVMPDRDGTPRLLDESWDQARARIAQVGVHLGGPLVVLAGDVGAALALSLGGELPILALALFSPSDPGELGAAYRRSLRRGGRLTRLGLFGRLRGRARTSAAGEVAAHAGLLGPGATAEDTQPEPRRLLDELQGGIGFVRPACHPPALVFASSNDPLVSEDQALGFSAGPAARAARTRLDGRFFPRPRAASLADEIQRFLILTLGDRVVDFPAEATED